MPLASTGHVWTRMTPVRITKVTRESARSSASDFQGVALQSVRGRVGEALEVCVDSAQENPTVVVVAEDGETSHTQRRECIDEHARLWHRGSPRWASCCVAPVERANESGNLKDKNE